MLFGIYVFNLIWDEVLKIVIYLINRSPAKSRNSDQNIPRKIIFYEALHGTIPDLAGLRRFRYIIYIFKEPAESEKFKSRL